MNAYDLMSSQETLNSRKSKILCSYYRPCKRMTCENCRKTRREYFVDSGLILAKKHNLNTHLIISWNWSKCDENWLKLSDNVSRLSKKMSGIRIKPYIRVISIGEQGNPHIHFLTNSQTSEKIITSAYKLWSPESLVIYQSEANYPEGLLGYFFDQNFIPSYLDSNRIKGIRLLAASRPMRCGFPTYRDLQNLSTTLH